MILAVALLILILLIVALSFYHFGFIEKTDKTFRVSQGAASKYEAFFLKTSLAPYYEALKKTIYTNELLDEGLLQQKAFNHMFFVCCRTAVIGAVFFIATRDVFSLLVVPFSVIFFEGAIIKYLRHHDQTQALRAGIELLKNKYIKYDNCKKAIEETIHERSGSLARHLEELYRLIELPSEEAKAALEDYIESIPSDYLKLVAINNHLTYFEGDAREDGESIYVTNLQSIINQMNFEMTMKDKFFRDIETDNLRILSPIISLPLIKYGMTYFASRLPGVSLDLIGFYNGPLGQVVVFLTLLLVLSVYTVYAKFVKDKYIQVSKVYKVNPISLPLVKVIMPKEGSKKGRKIEKQLLLSKQLMKIEVLYQQKIKALIISVLLAFVFMQVNSLIAEHDILSQLTVTSETSSMYTNRLYGDEKSKAGRLEADKVIINKFKKEKIEGEAIKEKLLALGLDERDVDRVSEKIILMRKVESKVYQQLVILILIGMIGYSYPSFLVWLDYKVNETAYLDQDIMRLYNVAIILSKNEKMTVGEMLHWMEMLSISFKPIFAEINQDYHTKGTDIITAVYERVPYDEIKLLLDNIRSGEDMPLIKALRGVSHSLKAKQLDQSEKSNYSINLQVSLSDKLAEFVQSWTAIFYGGLPLAVAIGKLFLQSYKSVIGG